MVARLQPEPIESYPYWNLNEYAWQDWNLISVIESYPYWNLNSFLIFLISRINSIESYPYWNLNVLFQLNEILSGLH